MIAPLGRGFLPLVRTVAHLLYYMEYGILRPAIPKIRCTAVMPQICIVSDTDIVSNTDIDSNTDLDSNTDSNSDSDIDIIHILNSL